MRLVDYFLTLDLPEKGNDPRGKMDALKRNQERSAIRLHDVGLIMNECDVYTK